MLGPGDRNAGIDRIPEIAWRLPFWFCQMSAAGMLLCPASIMFVLWERLSPKKIIGRDKKQTC